MMKTKTPKNKQWIIAFDNDSFNYSPSLELISACKKIKLKGWKQKSTVQKKCDYLNSL